jgi:hypothetical protein
VTFVFSLPLPFIPSTQIPSLSSTLRRNTILTVHFCS